MQESLLLIRREADEKPDLSAQQMHQFLKDVQTYITGLVANGNLKSAQSLTKVGKMLSGTRGAIKDGPYHLLAKDLGEAVTIAKANPEFVYFKSGKIEVRPIKNDFVCWFPQNSNLKTHIR